MHYITYKVPDFTWFGPNYLHRTIFLQTIQRELLWLEMVKEHVWRHKNYSIDKVSDIQVQNSSHVRAKLSLTRSYIRYGIHTEYIYSAIDQREYSSSGLPLKKLFCLEVSSAKHPWRQAVPGKGIRRRFVLLRSVYGLVISSAFKCRIIIIIKKMF